MIRGPGAASEFEPPAATGLADGELARLVDVPVDGPLTSVRPHLIFIVVILFGVGFFSVMAGPLGFLQPVSTSLPSPWRRFGMAAVAIGLMAAIPWWRDVRNRRQVRSDLAGVGDDDLNAAMRRAAARGAVDGRKMLATAAAQLATDGRRGLAVRFSDHRSQPVRPMERPFEPEPLGEVRSVAAWLTGNDPAADEGIRRTMWRNVRMKGGWAIVAIFVVNLLLAMFESWRSQRLTFALLAWSLALAALFLAPVLWSGAGQWLVAPAALIHRAPAWPWRPLTPRLFANRTSVLVTGRIARQLWGFAVSDGRNTESGFGTCEDMDALLSAWLSPLPPPEPGRISDLE